MGLFGVLEGAVIRVGTLNRILVAILILDAQVLGLAFDGFAYGPFGVIDDDDWLRFVPAHDEIGLEAAETADVQPVLPVVILLRDWRPFDAEEFAAAHPITRHARHLAGHGFERIALFGGGRGVQVQRVAFRRLHAADLQAVELDAVEVPLLDPVGVYRVAVTVRRWSLTEIARAGHAAGAGFAKLASDLPTVVCGGRPAMGDDQTAKERQAR